MNNLDLPLMIQGDAVRLRQVLYNLIANGLRFTSRGGYVTVQVGEEGDSLYLSVKDTGCGIRAERLPRIFELYHHMDDSENTTNNLGLGLYIARAIVEAHKGNIEVTSKVGQGTVFTVRLPCCDPEYAYSHKISHTDRKSVV